MHGIEKYPGDETLKTLLARYYPAVPFAELRAATAGVVLTVETVPPSELFEHLFGDEDDRAEFEDMDSAQKWFSCMMGFWNEMTAHQKADRPFFFSDWPPSFSDGNEGLLHSAIAREKEIEQFLWGLQTGGTPFADDFVDPTPKSLTSWLPSCLEFSLKVMKRTRKELESGKSKDRVLLGSAHFALNGLVKEHYAKFVENTLDLRQQWIAEMKQSETFARSEPKLGRNDPCPCGSGKKFKRCCLQ